MLIIRSRHSLAKTLLDEMRNRIISDAELEYLRHRAWKIRLRELSFPCLAQPATLGNLLRVSGTITFRVRVPESCSRPQRKDQNWNQNDQRSSDLPPVTTLPGRLRWRRCISHCLSGQGMRFTRELALSRSQKITK